MHYRRSLYETQRLHDAAERSARRLRTEALGHCVATLAQWAVRSAKQLASAAVRVASAAAQQRLTGNRTPKGTPCQP